MAEYPQHFKPGDPPLLSAAMFNDMLAIIRMWKRGEIGPAPKSPDRTQIIGKAVNDSGIDLPRFGVVALRDPAHDFYAGDPPDDIDRDLTVLVDIPSSPGDCGRFGILLEPLPNSAEERKPIGRVVMSGLVKARVNVTNVDHRYADITDGDETMLTSRDIGGAQLMYPAAEVGERIMWVRVGLPVPRMRTGTLDYNMHNGETTEATFIDEARSVPVLCPLVKAGYGLASGTTLIMFPQPDVDAWLGFAVDDCVKLVASLDSGNDDPDYEA